MPGSSRFARIIGLLGVIISFRVPKYADGAVQQPGGLSTFFSLHYHLVFLTKHRHRFIRREWRPRLHSFLGGIIRGMNGVPEIVGGVEDHLHLLVSLRPVHRIADVLRDLKKDSTNWAKANFDRKFLWQEGYSAFTRESR